MAVSQSQTITNFNIGGLNLYTNPLYNQNGQDGILLRAVNVDSYPLGAKTKRPGYQTFLNNLGTQTQNLFSFSKSDGTSIFLYNFSGGTLQFYDAGIGTATSWTPCVNGTFSGGTHLGHTILLDTLICGDGVNPTRHTTDGTTFTNTTLAPVGEHFEQYQNRVYIGGTASTLFYSVTNDATNWNLTGTSDSSSLQIPGAGKINKVFKVADRLHINKTQRNLFRWDGYTLYDMSTTIGMTSPYSFGTVEDSGFYINQLGVYLIDSNGPQLISNAITRYFYNESSLGALGTSFGTAPGKVHKYDYYAAIGSTQDDFTNEPLNNAIVKYNYQKNEFLMYQFTDAPTAFHSYIDNMGSQQMIFGGTAGQVFKYGNTTTNDNGNTIPAVIDMLFNFNQPHFDKEWRFIWLFFNPGCEAQVSVAMSNTFIKGKKQWIDLGDATSGIVQFKFPNAARSKLLYLKIREASKTSRFTFYGCAIEAKVLDPDA